MRVKQKQIHPQGEDRWFPQPNGIDSYMGGKTHLHSRGYVYERADWHPRSKARGYVLQHILVVEDVLKCSIDDNRKVHIHHIDGDKKNNRFENLAVLSAQQHLRLHPKKKRLCEKTIENLFAQGCTIRQVAAKIKVCPDTLVRRYSHLVPKPVELTKEKVRQALQGRTTIQAAEILGVHHQTLRNRFDYLLKKRKKPLKESVAVMKKIRMYANNPEKSLRDLTAETGISVTLAVRLLKKHQILWKTYRGRSHNTVSIVSYG